MTIIKPNSHSRQDLAVYIHWPFCKAKCPYCDFNSHVRENVNNDSWKNALLSELHYMSEIIGDKFIPRSIFFGGGTPSLMPPEIVEALINEVVRIFNLDDDQKNNLEITLEANPTSSEAEKFEAFKNAGVNRLSIGVQSLNDDSLKFLGREHSAAEALEIVNMARAIFDNYSFDMIYTLPEQSLKNWEKELSSAMPYTNGHMSLYQLTIEPGTAFYHYDKRGDFKMPENDLAADFYELTSEIMKDNQYEIYEISNYAIENKECIHNLAYWRGKPYMGIGPGAHGRVIDKNGRWHRTNTIKSPERWLSSLKKLSHGIEELEEITPIERAEEIFMSAMRLKEGINKTLFNKLSTINIEQMVNTDQLIKLEKMKFIYNDDKTLKVTDKGMLLVDSIIASLINY